MIHTPFPSKSEFVIAQVVGDGDRRTPARRRSPASSITAARPAADHAKASNTFLFRFYFHFGYYIQLSENHPQLTSSPIFPIPPQTMPPKEKASDFDLPCFLLVFFVSLNPFSSIPLYSSSDFTIAEVNA